MKKHRTDDLERWQVQIDVQLYPDGEWITVIKSALFLSQEAADDWCEEFDYADPLPDGMSVRAVVVELDADGEVIEDAKTRY